MNYILINDIYIKQEELNRSDQSYTNPTDPKLQFQLKMIHLHLHTKERQKISESDNEEIDFSCSTGSRYNVLIV